MFPRRLLVVCRRFGTLYRFHLQGLDVFARLTKTQHPATTAPKETVINLTDQKLDDGVFSLLQKGLNYAVAPRVTPIEEILAGVEKAVLSLPVEKAGESRHETESSKPPREPGTT